MSCIIDEKEVTMFLSSRAANRCLEVAWADLLAFCFAH